MSCNSVFSSPYTTSKPSISLIGPILKIHARFNHFSTSFLMPPLWATPSPSNGLITHLSVSSLGVPPSLYCYPSGYFKNANKIMSTPAKHLKWNPDTFTMAASHSHLLSLALLILTIPTVLLFLNPLTLFSLYSFHISYILCLDCCLRIFSSYFFTLFRAQALIITWNYNDH